MKRFKEVYRHAAEFGTRGLGFPYSTTTARDSINEHLWNCELAARGLPIRSFLKVSMLAGERLRFENILGYEFDQ